MSQARKARAIGFNHVALEVGDIEEALIFYGRLFNFELRGKSGTSRSRRAVRNPLMTAAILDLWSTTRTQSARRWPTQASNRCSTSTAILIHKFTSHEAIQMARPLLVS